MSSFFLLESVTAEFLRVLFGNWHHIRGIPRLLWWLRHLAFPSTPVLVKSPDNLPFILNREDYGQVMLYYFPYCRELQSLISDAVESGNTCLDLGANVGLLAAHMANCVGENGKVIAVEPNPPVFMQLNSMAGYSFPNQIIAVPVGVAEKDGIGGLYFPRGGFSESVEVMAKTDHGISLELLSITSIVRRFGYGQSLDFIKMDIEGNEAYLVESMSGLFEQGQRPILLVEFHPQKCEQRGVDAALVIQQLVNLGYQMRRVEKFNGSYRLVNSDNMQTGHDNILFITTSHLAGNRPLMLKWSE